MIENLSGSALGLLVILYHQHRRGDNSIFITQAALASQLECTPPSICISIKQLVREGFLTKHRASGTKSQCSWDERRNVYYFTQCGMGFFKKLHENAG